MKAFAVSVMLALSWVLPAVAANDSPIKVASVSLWNAEVVRQDGSDIFLAFDLNNGEGEQPEITYAVILSDQDKNVEDRAIYGDDRIALGPDQTVHKEISYHAPEYLSGNYQVAIEARNRQGMRLAMLSAGNVMLSGTGNYVRVSSCYLRVGEDSGKKYSIQQGVDVDGKENLVAFCTLTNMFDHAISVVPRLETRMRSPYGDIIRDDDADGIYLAKGSSVENKFSIIKPSDPQAYEVVMSLDDDQGAKVSNAVDFHYVLRGESATIQNVIMDRDGYSEGDTARVSFVWSGSADSFPGSRKGSSTQDAPYSYSIGIMSRGKSCADNASGELNANGSGLSVSNANIRIKTDCPDPVVSISVLNGSAKAIGRSVFVFRSNGSDDGSESLATSSHDRMMAVAVVVLLTALLIVAIIVAYRRKIHPRMSMLFLAISASFLISTECAKADSFFVGGASYNVYILDKKVYSPGETIRVFGYADELAVCRNEAHHGTSLKAKLADYSQWMYKECGGDDDQFFGDPSGYGTVVYFSAPSAPGKYEIVFTGSGLDCSGTGDYAISFVVVAPSSVGSCGSAAGGSYDSAPSAGLCLSGAASAVSGAGPWNWTCAGSGGGEDAYCSASVRSVGGSCGSSNGKSLSSKPVSGLCLSGVASAVSGSGPWTWSCNGLFGGANASCSASESVKPCVPKYSYSCNANSFCGAGECGMRTKSATCLRKNSCGGSEIVSASECSSHSVPCVASRIIDCGVCNMGQWTEK